MHPRQVALLWEHLFWVKRNDVILIDTVIAVKTVVSVGRETICRKRKFTRA